MSSDKRGSTAATYIDISQIIMIFCMGYIIEYHNNNYTNSYQVREGIQLHLVTALAEN